ncbi:MAG: hypothetical protein KGI27_09325 [Thaumarchaeota archaeon]|nr:hypothetical protein [Nitrososphaerota archaeon]
MTARNLENCVGEQVGLKEQKEKSFEKKDGIEKIIEKAKQNGDESRNYDKQ